MLQMQDRINDPSEISESDIAARISSGKRVILQFSCPSYTSKILQKIDVFCRRYGDSLEIRFYGHYSGDFDCSVVRQIPSVTSLSVDCLTSASNVQALYELPHLRSLSLGIYELNEPRFLHSRNLQSLHSLTLGESKGNALDLSPLATFANLRKLVLVGHTKSIESLGALKQLTSLTLSRIKNTVSLGFVSYLDDLRELTLILGGRSGISEITHPALRKLEIIRVHGFEQFTTEAFPALEELKIED